MSNTERRPETDMQSREATDSPMPVKSADRSTTSPTNQNPAAVHLISDAPYAHGAYLAHGYDVVPVVKTVVVDFWIRTRSSFGRTSWMCSSFGHCSRRTRLWSDSALLRGF
ncbi:hypothetical protein TNIN_285821 [Trichonephila inaurata madagascariensis]|uniref:Uncharacterized protein n=1 Tax=Trichonephila inaurata madagascariensis TaxID=2747483 RepID=A0A8X6WRN6_9ARAC|nr:hypothetical protein TNIN_285821 [Trichonephila inaurata madagascariensis]